MNYAQYQQLYGEAKAQIAARVDKIQPRAGNGASVNGMGISVQTPMVEEEPQLPVGWRLYLFAEVDGAIFWIGVFGPYLSSRNEAFFLETGIFWSNLVLLDDPIRMRFLARAIDDKVFRTRLAPNGGVLFTDDDALFEASYYRIPVRLTIEQYDVTNPGVEGRVVAAYNLQLRREGQSQLFVPIGDRASQKLRIKGFRLL